MSGIDPVETQLVGKVAMDAIELLRSCDVQAVNKFVHSGNDLIHVRVAIARQEDCGNE